MSLRRNRQDPPTRMPGMTPRRTHWMTVVGDTRAAAATSFAVSRSVSCIFATYRHLARNVKTHYSRHIRPVSPDRAI